MLGSESCQTPILNCRWMTGEWSECTVTCGGGHQKRSAYCIERHNDSSGLIENTKVADQYCWQSKRPVTVRKCGRRECPKWVTGDWTACSVTCGKGIRSRLIECQQEGERIDRTVCNTLEIPEQQQPCYAGVKCPEDFIPSGYC
ncbi:unnamed protein product [Anisakis simplex]|uniref:Thrombospondin type-1 domain-containing protein 4 n=1 Tax=Anisakis simplex TaxID=6269 RepID=A0A0M3JZX8_ANISI|nr:unnamed protein product [Anisakis simplex]